MKKLLTNGIESNSSFTNEIIEQYETIYHTKAPPIEVDNTHREYDWTPRQKHYSYSVPTSPRHSYKHRQEKLENERKNNNVKSKSKKLDLPTIDPESKMTFTSELEFKINHYAEQQKAKENLKERENMCFNTEIHNCNLDGDTSQMLIGDHLKTHT